jgi:two-component system, LytTR family, response regulator
VTAPIRTLIVDDEEAARDVLRLLLGQDPEIELVGESGDGLAALDQLRHTRPELVFLDVQMPAMDGLTVLGQLEEAELPAVVFVTAYDQHALKAFELHAVDYLLKPFDDARFFRALARAKDRVRLGQLGSLAAPLLACLRGLERPAPGRWLERLVVREDGRSLIVPLSEVDWIEARGDYLRVHAGKAIHLLRGTMKELERQLNPATFIRIHRSTIVRLGRIRELQPYLRGDYVVLLADGTRLRLARGLRDRVESALGQTP